MRISKISKVNQLLVHVLVDFYSLLNFHCLTSDPHRSFFSLSSQPDNLIRSFNSQGEPYETHVFFSIQFISMNNMHRLYLGFFLLCIMEIHALHRRCINSGVPFSERITHSPVMVYGQVLSKRIYVDSNTELLYNVTFRVDCILKGQEIEQEIEITEAGRDRMICFFRKIIGVFQGIKSGHTACQWLDPGHIYVIFLEKWGTNVNTYRPIDFPELFMDNKTEDLLAKTCHLSRMQPLHSSINHCPNVSMIKYCPRMFHSYSTDLIFLFR